MRTAFVKMHLESDNVVLPVPFGTPIIDIFCPMFDFLAPMQMAVVGILFQIDGLIAKSHFLFSALFRDFSENRPYSCVRD